MLLFSIACWAELHLIHISCLPKKELQSALIRASAENINDFEVYF